MEDEQIVDLYLARDERAMEQTAPKFGPRLCPMASVCHLCKPAGA